MKIRFLNQFTGKNQCLDIINDGTNNKLHMASCGNYSGQQWNVVPIDDTTYFTNFTCQLQNDFSRGANGDKLCLDTNGDTLIMNPCSKDAPTQRWLSPINEVTYTYPNTNTTINYNIPYFINNWQGWPPKLPSGQKQYQAVGVKNNGLLVGDIESFYNNLKQQWYSLNFSNNS
jgi:hypothetical protein